MLLEYHFVENDPQRPNIREGSHLVVHHQVRGSVVSCPLAHPASGRHLQDVYTSRSCHVVLQLSRTAQVAEDVLSVSFDQDVFGFEIEVQNMIFGEVVESLGDNIEEEKEFLEFPLFFHEGVEAAHFIVGSH